jgi:C-terminal processing protease CtpA/Prc
MILEPTKRTAEPFEPTMTGLYLADAPGPIRVCAVIEDSPAGMAGILPGDELVSIDERQTRDMTVATVRSLLRQNGAVYALTLRRGDRSIKTSLEVKDLL